MKQAELDIAAFPNKKQSFLTHIGLLICRHGHKIINTHFHTIFCNEKA